MISCLSFGHLEELVIARDQLHDFDVVKFQRFQSIDSLRVQKFKLD